MRKNVTIIGVNFISKGILKDDELFLEVSYDVLIPFKTDAKYEVVEINYNDFSRSMYNKNKLLERKIINLEKQISENYSSIYLKKYFSELKTNLADFETITKVSELYCSYLDDIVFGKNKWSNLSSEIKNLDIDRIEKDVKHCELFYQYYLEKNLKG